jgi:hypothetical protein
MSPQRLERSGDEGAGRCEGDTSLFSKAFYKILMIRGGEYGRKGFLSHSVSFCLTQSANEGNIFRGITQDSDGKALKSGTEKNGKGRFGDGLRDLTLIILISP